MQLKMHLTFDEQPPVAPVLPSECELKTFAEAENALDDWLDTVCCGLSEKRMDEAYYRMAMDRHNYTPRLCFLLYADGECAATITVIPDLEKAGEGYIHMVACKDKFRGRGYGNLLTRIALYALKKEGQTSAFLTTDDFRIPTIKSYLRAGFVPVYNAENSEERWSKVLQAAKAPL